MLYVAIVLLSIVAVEIFRRLPLIGSARRLMGVMHKSLAVVSSRAISDHWKEKVLVHYALDIMKLSLLVGGIILAGVIVILAGAYLVDTLLTPDPLLSEALFSWTGIIVATVTAVVQLQVYKHLEKP